MSNIKLNLNMFKFKMDLKALKVLNIMVVIAMSIIAYEAITLRVLFDNLSKTENRFVYTDSANVERFATSCMRYYFDKYCTLKGGVLTTDVKSYRRVK